MRSLAEFVVAVPGPGLLAAYSLKPATFADRGCGQVVKVAVTLAEISVGQRGGHGLATPP